MVRRGKERREQDGATEGRRSQNAELMSQSAKGEQPHELRRIRHAFRRTRWRSMDEEVSPDAGGEQPLKEKLGGNPPELLDRLLHDAESRGTLRKD